MFFPFLLSIQLVANSLANPVYFESNDFNAFSAASGLIPSSSDNSFDSSHDWIGASPSFDWPGSQPPIVSHFRSGLGFLSSSSSADDDGSNTAFISAQKGSCLGGKNGIHRRDGKICTLDGKTEEVKVE